MGATAATVLAVAVSPAAGTPRAADGLTGRVAGAAVTGTVITNAPTTIRLGAAVQTIPVVVRSSFTGRYAFAKLSDLRTGPRYGGAVTATTNRWTVPVPVVGKTLPHYGTWRWDVRVLDQASAAHNISVTTVVKANSLLGLRGTGGANSRVTLTVAVRVWNNAVARYQAWPSQGVYIQKQAANGTWANVGAVTADRNGNAVNTLTTGPGTYRVYDHDTGTIWGATSAAVRITAPTKPAPPANPGDAVNCSDFTTWRAAQNWYQTYYPYYGDVAHLDADHDGIACEDLPGAP